MATSRLKRKIDQAEQGQYGNLTESFVSVGTALPSLAEHKKDSNEFVPPWEQKVFDEQGRRRFHGAFTGGFSAGYYNSVGSKEGWTPSTFKSSRSNRASQDSRSVADAARQFMDEEDLAELASSRTLQTSSAYSSSNAQPTPSVSTYDPLLGNFGSLGAAAAPSASGAALPSLDDTLASLIQPSSLRVGLKLMRKMGWREGQGVGPRVTFAQRRKQAAELGLRLEDPEDQDGDAGEPDGEATKHYYAPLDRPLTLVKGTSASMDKGWGLGYRPGANLNQRLQKEDGGYASSARASAYELYDEDDVYGGAGPGIGTLGEREKRAVGVYDFDDDEEEAPGSIRSSRDRRRHQPSKRVGATTKEGFHDGTQVLPGFTVQREPVAGPSQSKVPPPPPPGWQPNPSRLWKEASSAVSANVKGKGRQLDADERGSLLGEKQPVPAPPTADLPKSVFDYLSAKSRERLASLTHTAAGAGPSPSAASGEPAAPAEPDEALFVPPLDRPTAQAALRGFQPYSAASTSPDPVKQARYTLYLQYQASGTATTTSSPFGPRVVSSSTPAGSGGGQGRLQTVAELNRELSEYAQAARVFKPVGGMLGSRFQSSVSGSLDVPKVAPGLYQPPPKAVDTTSQASGLEARYGNAASASSEPLAPPTPQLTPAQQAARAGNFGPGTTRTTAAFRPAKLVCKRFGVRDPYEAKAGGGAGEGEDGVGGAWGEATARGWGGGGGGLTPRQQAPVGEGALDEMRRSAGFQRFQSAAAEARSAEVGEDAPEVAKGTFEAPRAGGLDEEGVPPGRTRRPAAPRTLETVGYGDDEDQGREILEEKRAPADIFAAIFADSDDDDDDDEEAEEDDGGAGDGGGAHEGGAPVARLDGWMTAVAAAPAAIADPVPPTPLSLDSLPSYRPAFVPSSVRTGSSCPSAAVEAVARPDDRKDGRDRKKKDPSDRKKRDKKRRATGLSFALDDHEEEAGGTDRNGYHDGKGEGEEEEEERRRRKKKKLRREREREGGDRERERERERVGSAVKARQGDGTDGKKDQDEDEWAEAPSQVHPDVLAALAASGTTTAPAAKEEGHSEQGQGRTPALAGTAPSRGAGARMKAADLY